MAEESKSDRYGDQPISTEMYPPGEVITYDISSISLVYGNMYGEFSFNGRPISQAPLTLFWKSTKDIPYSPVEFPLFDEDMPGEHRITLEASLPNLSENSKRINSGWDNSLTLLEDDESIVLDFFYRRYFSETMVARLFHVIRPLERRTVSRLMKKVVGKLVAAYRRENIQEYNGD